MFATLKFHTIMLAYAIISTSNNNSTCGMPMPIFVSTIFVSIFAKNLVVHEDNDEVLGLGHTF